MSAVATGLDRLLARLADEPGLLAGKRYALLAHAASVTERLVPAHLALAASPAGPPARLLAPEHGYYGVEQDMVPAADQRDPWTGAPIASLYGDSAASLRPSPAAFAGVDVLVIDVQDVGARYYTYAATAVWAAEAALAAGCAVWVLDRPNPLGGEAIEGSRVEPGFESFVGAFPLPARHGMTVGELVRWQALARGWPHAEVGAGAASREPGLTVWRMEGWRREMGWEETGRPWIAPSPNMPTPATAWLYPGGCLIEGTAISEGRGTTRPFHLVGAPGVDPPALARRLGERLAADPESGGGERGEGAPGAALVPTYFRPQFQKHAGEVCGGVEIVVTDRRALRPYRFGVHLLAALAEVAPDAFAWRSEEYEFVTDVPAIDLLAGSAALREAIDAGSGLEDWMAGWPADEAAFRAERRPALLYPEAEGPAETVGAAGLAAAGGVA